MLPPLCYRGIIKGNPLASGRMEPNDNDFWTPAGQLGLVVVTYVILAIASRRQGEVAARLFIVCTAALMCIWFPDSLGHYRGSAFALAGCHYRSVTTPDRFHSRLGAVNFTRRRRCCRTCFDETS